MATTIYDGSVTLYKGVPFDKTYQNILEPDSFLNKFNTLNSVYTHDTVNNIQTVKMNTTTGNGTIRLTVKARSAYEYNYMYINDYKHGMQFFAFINGCIYINDGPSDSNTPVEQSQNYKCVFEFDITKDVMMTCVTSMSEFKPAPIIRHTATPIKYTNPMYQESINIGEAVYKTWSMNSELGVSWYNDSLSVVFISYAQQTNYTYMYDIPNATMGVVFQSAADAINKIEEWSQAPGFQVHSIYVVPKFVYNGDPSSISTDGEKIDNTKFKSYVDFTPFSKNELKGYVDSIAKVTRNKKCRYYPFTKIRLVSNCGDTADLAPEYLSGTAFRANCTGLSPCSVTLEPLEYYETNTRPNKGDVLPYKRVSTGTYPMGNGAVDSYAAYLASRFNDVKSANGELIAQIAYSSLGSTVAGYAKGGLVGAASSLAMATIGTVSNEIKTLDAISRTGPSISGTVPSPDVDYSHGDVDVKIELVSVLPDLMQSLDDYFERYGYAQGGVLNTPDLIGRDRYVYVRTGGECFFNSKCNTSEHTLINNAFMNGVTIWKHAALTANSGALIYGNNGEDPIAEALYGNNDDPNAETP